MKIALNRNFLYLVVIIAIACGIRLYQLGTVPISLHGDEIGVGYNAYSLLTSGIDEYGKRWPLVLRADVAPAIFYTTIPSIAVFGTNEFAVRFPSVVISIISLLIFYVLVTELFDAKKALIATFLLSLSPWHIQISRIAHDAPYGLLLQLVATVLFLKGTKSKPILTLLSFILFGLSFYTYHSPRLTSPLLLIGLLCIFRKEIARMKKTLLYGFILFILTITPITVDFLNKPISETRFGGISIFTRQDTSVPLTPFYFIRMIPTFVGNYLNQFNPYSLFFDTSTMRYFNVRFNGLLQYWELPAIIFGIYTLYKTKERQKYLVLFWILISVLPGALTQGSPNAGRIFMLAPMLSLLGGIGITTIIDKKIISPNILMIVILSNTMFFSYWYFIDAPNVFAHQWQYGLKSMAQKVVSREREFDHIVITDQAKQAYIYILFYGRKDPRWLMAQPNKKRHPFIGYSAFGNYEFRAIQWSDDQYLTNTLLVGTAEEIPTIIPALFEIRSLSNGASLRVVSTKEL